jgi:4-hydroxybenzoate polyprenyltransferase
MPPPADSYASRPAAQPEPEATANPLFRTVEESREGWRHRLSTLPQRGWIYQQERFPLFKHGLLIAIFSGATVGYGASLTATTPSLASALVAFVSTFGFFWQMRVADEFKDLADDAQYRPYRPVPRGLVSLRELAMLGLLSAGLQALLAVWLFPSLLGLLVGVWAYFGLMGQEFFVRHWLKAHPVAYVLSHMVIVPLIGGYAIATQTLPTAGTAFPAGTLPFLLACFCNGLVIELGRKTRLPPGEEPGVETYSALWGLPMALRLWLGAVLLTTLFALLAAAQIQVLPIVVPILAGLIVWIGFKVRPLLGVARPLPPARPAPSGCPEGEAGSRVWADLPLPLPGGDDRSDSPDIPASNSSELTLNQLRRYREILDTPTALWTLGVYLSLGWLPVLLWR